MFGELVDNFKETIQDTFTKIKEEVNVGNDELKKIIDENQEASINRIVAIESELAKIGEIQKQNKRNKHGFTQVGFYLNEKFD